MKKQKSAATGLVAAGLVAGLTLGSIGIATAATGSLAASSTPTSSTAAAAANSAQPHDRGPGKDAMHGIGDIAEAVASLTGLTESEVQTQRQVSGASYASIAKAKNVSVDDVVAKTVEIEKAELAADVKSGKLTQAEADTITKTLAANMKTAVESTEALRGPGGPGDHGKGGKGGGHGMGDIAEAVASLTGLTESDVQTKREAGTSYAAIAKTKNVSADQVVAKTVEIEKAELAADVKSGKLTQAEADTITKTLAANIKTAVESTEALRGPGGPGGHGDRNGDGPGASGSTSSGTTGTTATQ